MQLKQLTYFVTVVECGSFRRAAEELYLAQSSLSQAVGNLEKELGFSLLRRGREGTAPTEMGELVYEQSKQLLDQAGQLARGWKDTWRARAALVGTVRIAAVPGLYPYLAGGVLARMEETYPNLTVRISELRGGILPGCLAQGQADLVVGDFLEEEQEAFGRLAAECGIEVTPLRQDVYELAVGADTPLAQRENLTAAEAAALPLACYSGGDAAARHFFERGFDPALRLEYNSMEKIIQAAAQGRAASVLPRWTTQVSLRGMKGAPGLRFLTLEGFRVPFVHYLAVRRDTASPGAAAAGEMIRRAFED